MIRCWSDSLDVQQLIAPAPARDSHSRSRGAGLRRALLSLLAVALCLLISPAVRAQGAPAPSPEGRVRVTYWEKWTGMEKEAMESVIQDFNRSQPRIWVEYQSVSQYQHKTLIATAGGDPPDIAGLLAADIADFADKNALVPLDDLMRVRTSAARSSCLCTGTWASIETVSGPWSPCPSW